jgi:hypothetical protein
MKDKEGKSILSNVPSWVLALLTLTGATIVLFVVDGTMMPYFKTGNMAYDIFDLLIVVGCFFIARQNPKSFWYIPIICNAPFIVSAVVKPDIWNTLLWIPIVSGFGVSFLASIIGALVGKRDVSRNVV